MGRPLAGSRWERGARFYGSVPAGRGSRKRVEAGFGSAADRDAWLTAALAALTAERSLPDPDVYRRRQVAAPAEGGSSSAAWPSFEELAHGWLDEYYSRLRNADPERERDVRIMVERHLIPALAGPIPPDPAVARRRLVEFVRRLAGHTGADHAPVAAVDGPPVTVNEAIAISATSKSTVRRALRAGQLPGARRDAGGCWLIPRSDLVAAGLLRSPSRCSPMSRAYATGIVWAHDKILEWARMNGWHIPEYERGVHALTPDDERARKDPEVGLRRPLSMAEVARVATHLHAVHQLALWLMRVLGLRISEAFGPRVGDIVDLGEVGVVFIRRQGGRPFLVRTPEGVQTVYSKRTLKRAASHRVVVVPPALMAMVHVAIAAFHTDPESGEVDLEARLVPWLNKEDRGQIAFRFALDSAFRAEGFDVDSCGFEVTTHDLRKSLATDLAWNDELDELAKRRVMGHKAGDDVFARVYTLDHPTLAPLAKVASAVEADITAQIGSLIVPTDQRVRFGADNPLRARAAHVDAVLAEAGWQVEPGDPNNPWCDAARVAAELDIAVTTARRWMRDQVVPSTTRADRYGNEHRRSRLLDVHATRDRLAKRILLRDLAAEIGVGYHLAYHALKRLGIEPDRDERTDELVLRPQQADAVRAEFNRLAELKRRSMRVSEAATRLGVSVSTIKRYITIDELEEDAERDPYGAQYVTRSSVEALCIERTGRANVDADDLVPLEQLVAMTGLTVVHIGELVTRGLLVRSDVDRHFHVTKESIRRWATGFRPDLLEAVDSDDPGGMSCA